MRRGVWQIQIGMCFFARKHIGKMRRKAMKNTGFDKANV